MERDEEHRAAWREKRRYECHADLQDDLHGGSQEERVIELLLSCTKNKNL